MTDELQDTFGDFARGVTSPATFEHALLMLCRQTPDRAWEALALLDQHYRRGRVAAELQHSLRQRIERQALGIESYQPERAPLPQIAVARAIPVAPDADAEDPTIEPIPKPAPAPESCATADARIDYRQDATACSDSCAEPPLAPVLSCVARNRPDGSDACSRRVIYGRGRQYNALTADAGTPGSGTAAAARSDSNPATSANPPAQVPDMLSLSSDRYIVDPDIGIAELSVERSPDAAGDTSFLWWTEGSGAKPNEDYVAAKPRRVQMAEGVGTSTLRIPLLRNPHRRHVEMFYVLIGRPGGSTGIGPIHRATIFLLPQRALTSVRRVTQIGGVGAVRHAITTTLVVARFGVSTVERLGARPYHQIRSLARIS